MKAFDSICCHAVMALAILFCLILSTPVLADIFPVELLDQQAVITNVPPAQVAISGNYLLTGPTASTATMFHRESGQWQELGSWPWPGAVYAGSRVALDGNTVAVGVATAGGSGRAFVFTPSGQPGLNAWNTTDRTNGSGVYYRYEYPLTNQWQLMATNGWTLTVRCRMVDDFNFSSNEPSCFVDCAINPTNRFLIWFSLDANLNLVAQLNGLQTLVLTTNGDGWAAYHTHRIVFNPTNNTADYYFDGVKMNTSPWSPTSVTPLNGVRFGNGSSAGEGSINWNLVKLTTQGTNVLASYQAGTNGNPGAALDPTNQGWNLIADDHSGSGSSNGPVSPDFETVWPLQAVLVSRGASEAQSGYGLGSSIAISSNTVVVGAPYENNYRGSAYVFVRNGSNWVQQAKLSPNPPAAVRDWFGYRVALNANTALVSDADNEDAGSNASVYVFVRTGTNWTQQWRLTNSPQNELNEFGSEFGNTVAVDGDHAAVSDFIANNNAGVVYVFGRTNGVWSQQAALLPNNPLSYGDFGDALALKGNVIAASGPYYTNSYIFASGPSGWIQVTNFVYADNSYPRVDSIAMDDASVAVCEGYGTGAIHIYSPDYSDPTAVADYVRKLLYYPDAENSLLYDTNQAAFRYKTLLYAQGTNGVFAEFKNIANLYGQAERDRADFAESQVAKGLAIHPYDSTLGNLLLNIYYDRAEAESIFANNLLTQAYAARFPSAISDLPTPASGFVIDDEIPLYEQALAANRDALDGYFSLFTNNLGQAGSPPLGYQIFTNLVPTRGLMPATYLDTNGTVQSVTSNNIPLFTGYKDLTLLFNQMQNYGETAVTLGKLLVARNNPGDRMEASNLVGSAQQLLFLNGQLLKGMFATLPGTNDPSGLAQSIDGWADGLSDLTTLQQNLAGGANLLGFAPDFMLYVHTLPTGSYGTSYDTLRNYLLNDPASPLVLATNALGTAENAYATYRDDQDQLAQQMTGLDQNYEDRLRDIVGAFPGSSNYSDNPTNNPGSLLDQQYEIILQARLKILQNQTDMSNLNQRVQIELDRASSVSNAIINYGSKEASIEETIGHIQAAQAASQAAADEVNTLVQAPETLATGAAGFVIAANAVNGGVQAGAEEAKGELEADKEQDAALQQATITGINSAAAVKTMLLDMKTLEIESQEDELQLQQALGQMAGLYREKQQLEQKIAQQNSSLAGRYYADPIHRLQAQADMVAANLAFNRAQEFLFFMQRALDYKWNTPMNTTALIGTNEITWTDNTIFKLRNAAELMDLFNAMDQWDAYEDLSGIIYHTNLDSFSVRSDFFGYSLTNSTGQVVTYPDPITGQPVGALPAFRDRLRQMMNTDDPNNSYIDLHFSTVRQIPGKAFFEGPAFDPVHGTVTFSGLALDKIRWVSVSLVGPSGDYVSGSLKYGGTSFMRNRYVGTYNPAQPDLLANEMTAYSTRYWYYDQALTNLPSADRFTSEDAQVATFDLAMTNGPSAYEDTSFAERSVATSDWVLRIPVTRLGVQVLNLNQLNDIQVWFNHYSADRLLQ